jgi:UDP-glucose 6-dehydrogenase
MLQEMYPDRFFFHSAEFLTERNARADVDNPSRNVIGYTEKSKQYASEILEILPKSEINIICTATESEM